MKVKELHFGLLKKVSSIIWGLLLSLVFSSNFKVMAYVCWHVLLAMLCDTITKPYTMLFMSMPHFSLEMLDREGLH